MGGRLGGVEYGADCVSLPYALLPASALRVIRSTVQEGPIGSTEQGHLDGLRIPGKQVESP